MHSFSGSPQSRQTRPQPLRIDFHSFGVNVPTRRPSRFARLAAISAIPCSDFCQRRRCSSVFSRFFNLDFLTDCTYHSGFSVRYLLFMRAVNCFTFSGFLSRYFLTYSLNFSLFSCAHFFMDCLRSSLFLTYQSAFFARILSRSRA